MRRNEAVAIDLFDSDHARVKQSDAISCAVCPRDAIDAAVFDLKAVNPNAIMKIDTRAPDEVIQSIDEQGQIVANALAKLRLLLRR